MLASKNRQKHFSQQSQISLVSIFSVIFFITLFLYPQSAFPAVATLTWDAPATNSDGTALTDLAGYKIYYGTGSGNYSQTIDVGNLTSSAVSNLADGTTYYFAMTAYDTSGNESQYSNEVSKTTQAVQQYSLAITKNGTGSGTVTSSAGGINCGTACTATYSPGSVVTLTAAPAGGSTFMGWSGGGCAGTGTCSLSMSANITVTATFAINTYTITATAGTGGTISPSGAVTVNSGASKMFTITPNTGYAISDVKVDGASVGAVTTYTFTNVTATHTIAATFGINTYSITATAGTGGTISPSGAVTVNSGASKMFTITPNTGYAISDVKVDGASVGAVTTYTFTNVTATHTIAATFGINTYSITATAGTGGTISPSGAVTVNSGASKMFTITPNTGYAISDVKVDGASVGAVTTYTFTNVTATHTIAATFAINTYSITATAGTGGTISPSGVVTVNSGANQTFAITPNTGYAVTDVKVDESSIGAVGTYTFSNVTGTHSLSVSFAPSDFDHDGISDIEEWGPQGNDPNYDGNNDGVTDYLQNNVASLHTADGSKYITIFSPDGYALADVRAEQIPEGTPIGAELLYQFIGFTVDTAVPGASTTVVVKLTDGVVVNNYYKYGPTPDNPAFHWYTFMFDGQTGAEISGNIVTLHFVDGLRGDDDLTANGQIVDQGGPAQTPVIGATPSSLGFGTTTVNTTSATQSVTISNTGLVPLSVSALTITGADAGDFAILAETCSLQTLGSSGTCTVSVVFAPHAAGNKSASLMISSDDPSMPVLVIPVYGTGIANYTITATAGTGGTISPSGAVTVNSGASRTFTITPNTGYVISNVTVDGTSVGVVSTYTFSNVTASHTISASFANSTIPAISVSPASYVFKSTKVGYSASKAFKITNIGKAKLSILKVVITGTDAKMFSTSFSGTKTLNPSSYFNQTVRFRPTSKGVKNAVLQITSNDPKTPVIAVPLSGQAYR